MGVILKYSLRDLLGIALAEEGGLLQRSRPLIKFKNEKSIYS